ncbi:MAG: ATP-binding protein [Planctomycetota bacterium]
MAELFACLGTEGDGAPSPEEKMDMVRLIRGMSPEATAQLDQFFLSEHQRLWHGMKKVEAIQAELRAKIEELTSPPWPTAVFVAPVHQDGQRRALVTVGSTSRVVLVPGDLDLNELQAGDDVMLSAAMNALIGKAPVPVCPGGEVVAFERYTTDRRLVVRVRDEEYVVRAGRSLMGVTLRPGDLVRWDRSVSMAFEKLELPDGERLFLEETPSETFDDIGGLDGLIERLTGSIRLHRERRDLVHRYHLNGLRGVLFTGPPGNGKTLIARAIANWFAQISPTGRSRFMNIKPGGLNSMWYGQTEKNYRDAFAAARRAAEQDSDIPVVMFFDEIDSVATTRTMSLVRVDDRVLPAFMAELCGLEPRHNVLVIAATNRPDALDPAVVRPGRLGDAIYEVPRPNRVAARAIFAKHLPAGIPIAGADEIGEAAREAAIEAAIARIYAPNGAGDLATLACRDGRRRAVKARDLVSGAIIAQIAKGAAYRAAMRECQTGAVGVRTEDLLEMADEVFEQTARLLTPANCRGHLTSLPHDIDVASVEVTRRAQAREQRYLQVAS